MFPVDVAITGKDAKDNIRARERTPRPISVHLFFMSQRTGVFYLLVPSDFNPNVFKIGKGILGTSYFLDRFPTS